jgi:plasmid stabilization system protein ParE
VNRYAVVYTPRASRQLAALHRYLVRKASLTTADRYVDAILARCADLSLFPQRGTGRRDLYPGLRVTNHRGRTIVAYTVDDVALRVAIVGVFYGGQNYEAAFKP